MVQVCQNLTLDIFKGYGVTDRVTSLLTKNLGFESWEWKNLWQGVIHSKWSPMQQHKFKYNQALI